MLDGGFVTFLGAPSRSLPAPAHVAEQAPDVAGVIDDAGSLRDHLGDALERPDLGGVPAGSSPLKEHGLHGDQLLVGEFGMPPEALGELQCGNAALLPQRKPPAGRLTADAELGGHPSRANPLGEEGGGPFSALLESNEQLRRTARSARIVGVGGAGAERWRRHADIDSPPSHHVKPLGDPL